MEFIRSRLDKSEKSIMKVRLAAKRCRSSVVNMAQWKGMGVAKWGNYIFVYATGAFKYKFTTYTTISER